jgi:hypothetical protein
VNWFLSLADAKEKIEEFKNDYNGSVYLFMLK